MSTAFRSNEFDTVYTILQILTLQSSFYVTAGVCLWLLDGIVTQSAMIPTLRELFDARLLSQGKEQQYHKWCILLSFLLAGAGFGGVALRFIVRRAKLCVDFTLTLYCIHICICTLYAGSPTSFLWWATHVVSAIVMIFLGEYLCMRKELEPIQFSFNEYTNRDVIELQTITSQ
jgi:hypothetical protein